MRTVGRFEVRAVLGRGAMGEVLEAWDPELERIVALKLLLPKARRDPELRARFLREARISACLDHPGILPIFELGEDQGAPFLAMRKVEGTDLARLLRRRALHPRVAQEWPRHELLRRFSTICRALAHAHSRGILHRDLKPANLMMGPYGEALVMDWGIACRLDQQMVDTTLEFALVAPPPLEESDEDPSASGSLRPSSDATATGAILGTAGYFSPEQAAGKPVGPASDVWSLGAILYELICDGRAVPGKTWQERWNRTLHGAVQDPRELARVPDELASICLKALAREPFERFAHAADLAGAIDDHLAGSRRAELAAERLADAEAAWVQLEALDEERARLTARSEELEGVLPTWASLEEKGELLGVRRRLRQLVRDRAHAFGALVEGCEQALSQESGYEPAHALLARAWYRRFESAERAGDETEMAFSRERALAHDTGPVRALIEAPARLTLVTDPPGAEVFAQRLDRDELMWRPGPRQRLGVTPLGRELPPGSYVLSIEHPERAPTILPVLLQRGALEGGAVPLLTEAEIGPGWCYVPGGTALLVDAERGLPAVEQHVEGFLIQRLPVTMADWCVFLNDLSEEEARQHVPRHPPTLDGPGAPLWEYDGRWEVPERDADGDAWDPQWPAFHLAQGDAQAYAAWRGRREGVPMSLPTAAQLQKAGRGVDGRPYPWGDTFDSSLAKTNGSRPGRRLPEPVGRYPTDRSVYGVQDIAGGVQEWTSTPLDTGADPDLVQVVGGAWNLGPMSARLDRVWRAEPWELSAQIGFRLVRPLPGTLFE